jgi:hypothetical protein
VTAAAGLVGGEQEQQFGVARGERVRPAADAAADRDGGVVGTAQVDHQPGAQHLFGDLGGRAGERSDQPAVGQRLHRALAQ